MFNNHPLLAGDVLLQVRAKNVYLEILLGGGAPLTFGIFIIKSISFFIIIIIIIISTKGLYRSSFPMEP